MSRKKKHEEHVNHERWLVSYADFITLLFAFFVVMFAVSQVDQNKVGRFTESVQAATRWGVFQQQSAERIPQQSQGPGNGLISSVRKGGGEGNGGQGSTLTLKRQLESKLQKVLGDGRVSLIQSQEGLTVRLREAAFFDSGSAELRSRGLEALLLVAESLKDVPNGIRIEGHTDPKPIRTAVYRSNWDLSAARAASVLAYFSDRVGIEEERLSVAGYADRHPIASNDTDEGRRQNRRVDIVILENK